tara:strand:- start:1269 stop:1499 length:231 start_codon:yes stop_codon:yes gene_type:complete
MFGKGMWMWRGNIMSTTNGTGLTQKEMLILVMEGQEKINERIDILHEKVNSKMSRQELSGWMVAVSAFVVIINQLM